MPGLEGVNAMQQQALRMIFGMLALAIIVAVVDRNPLPLLVIIPVTFVLWHVAKGFGD